MGRHCLPVRLCPSRARPRPRSVSRLLPPATTHGKGARGRPRDFDSMAVEAWQPNAAKGWWLLADQTEDIYWRCWCYWRVVFPVPFKKKAKAVLPSSEAVGVDELLPAVSSKLPAVSPAINTPTIPS